MNGPEIKERLELNNKRLETLLRTFVLTDEVKNILKENEELKNICPHNYSEGICIFCGSLEEEENG